MRKAMIVTGALATLAVGLTACGSGDSSRPAGSASEQQSSEQGGSPSGATWLSAEDYRPSLFDQRAAEVDNRWYPLTPGMRLDYRGSSLDEGQRVHHGVTMIVTDLVKEVDGVPNAVVWERDYDEGQLVESELALFAQDTQGNVWHMGEYAEEWEDGEIDKAPTWVHGIKGATAGITIPGAPRTGTPDFAEGFAPAPVSWHDRGKVHATGQRVCVPADCYSDVAVVAEFEKDVPGAFQDKFYAPGVGVVRVGWRGRNDTDKEVLELVRSSTLSAHDLDKAREQALAQEDRAYRISKDVWAKTPHAQRAA